MSRIYNDQHRSFQDQFDTRKMEEWMERVKTGDDKA